MNHNSNQKNFNRSTAHRQAMFKNMVKSFDTNGHLTTTLPKAKHLQKMLAKLSTEAKVIRKGFRAGDRAEMAIVVSPEYVDRLNTKKKISKKSKK